MRNPLLVLLVAIATVGTGILVSAADLAVAKLSEEDMLSISAYLTSLEP